MAWGTTILYSDGADFYEERLSVGEDGKTYYEYMGQLLPVVEVATTIHVRGGAEVEFHYQKTHHGPIMQRVFAKGTA